MASSSASGSSTSPSPSPNPSAPAGSAQVDPNPSERDCVKILCGGMLNYLKRMLLLEEMQNLSACIVITLFLGVTLE